MPSNPALFMSLMNLRADDGVKAVIGIPDSQELIFFGVTGYPDEVAEARFPVPRLEEVCYFDLWKG